MDQAKTVRPERGHETMTAFRTVIEPSSPVLSDEERR
jgi:hypothetical protein